MRCVTISSLICSRCNEGLESICHALFDCNKVCEMWKTHPYFDSVQAAPRDSFVDCFLWLHFHSSTDGFESICASMWACWFARNKEVMDGSQSNIEQLSTAYVRCSRNTKSMQLRSFLIDLLTSYTHKTGVLLKKVG